MRAVSPSAPSPTKQTNKQINKYFLKREITFIASGVGGGHHITHQLTLTICIVSPKISYVALTALNLTGPQRPDRDQICPPSYYFPCPPGPRLRGSRDRPVRNQSHRPITSSYRNQGGTAPSYSCKAFPARAGPLCSPCKRVVALHGKQHPPPPGCECM